jgi:ferrochelatase
MPAHDAVLLLAYGGPTRFEEVRPFLDNVLRGKPVPRERYEEVVRHYQDVGGSSPLNRLTFGQAEALTALLRIEGPDLPVYVGMRHWEPFIEATLRRMAGEGRRRAVGVILAAHPSEASRDSYLEAVAGAKANIGGPAPAVDHVEAWFDHPLFIEANAARVAAACETLPEARRRDAALVFTAHSIPIPMAQRSSYPDHLARTAALVAGRLGIASWTMAWQSRSGGPRDPWLEPDISDALRALRGRGVADVVVAPIGFVSDHVEVLYDLDIAARKTAETIGLGFHRAGTVGDHPAFIRMLAAVVRDRMERG